MAEQVIREGKCIDCGAKIAILENGERTGCDCRSPKTPPTEQEKFFADWIRQKAKELPKHRF